MRAILTPFLNRGPSSETPPLNQEEEENQVEENQEEEEENQAVPNCTQIKKKKKFQPT